MSAEASPGLIGARSGVDGAVNPTGETVISEPTQASDEPAQPASEAGTFGKLASKIKEKLHT